MSGPGPVPGSAEWLGYMTASKIAAVAGTSSYESPFSLWHRMHGDIPSTAETSPVQEYGHYLEPALLRWFADHHPELTVYPGDRWTLRDGWAGATPDGVYSDGVDDEGLVEAKTGRLSWEWDDGVPAGYYDQVQWQMWVTGERVCWVVADVGMEFREYRVILDPERVEHLVTLARDFMASLADGTPPPIDSSAHTYVAIRNLHPDIEPEDVDLPGDLACSWLGAHDGLAIYTAAEQKAKSLIADYMGNARRALWDGQVIFTRQSRNGGTPYLVAGRNLPTLNTPGDPA